MNITQAIKEAERLKQKSIIEMQYHNYIVLRDKDNYVVEMFSYLVRNQAIKNNNFMYLTR
jgi:hypothetical protein